MNKENLKKYIGKENLSIVDAMRMIDVNSVGLLYIINNNNQLTGCLTDGDIRRWLIRTGKVEGVVQQAMNHSPLFIYEDDVRTGIKEMEKRQLYSIAIVNKQKEITDIIFLESLLKRKGKYKRKTLSDTPVIIMAGGKGTRLYPYTKILPKPLIPIGDIPILERILNRFYDFGVNEFYLVINYKKEMIKSYFSETIHSYHISYIDEDIPMGTAGGIRLIREKFERPVIITNCDILIETDYKKLLDFHISSSNDITIVSSMKNILVPYGVLYSKEQGVITAMKEKPQLSYFINTGMYIVNPDILDMIPEHSFFHMTDLSELLIKEGRQVGMYPISENSFLDMGEFEEMKKMEDRINKGYVK